MRALNRPAMAPEAVIALDPLACDVILDSSTFELRTASGMTLYPIQYRLEVETSGSIGPIFFYDPCIDKRTSRDWR
ncbi:hypothetical protein AAA534_16620 [Pseudomonas aeruginosa]